MKKNKDRAVKISGDALDIVQDLAKKSFRTLKGTSEMLILLGRQQLNEIDISIKENGLYEYLHSRKNKNSEDEE